MVIIHVESIYHLILKLAQKVYLKIVGKSKAEKLEVVYDIEEISNMIFNHLQNDEPYMIARYGGFELSVVLNYIGVKKHDKQIFKYIKGESSVWWWNKRLANLLQSNAGFFPITENNLCRYSELMIADSQQLDISAVFSSVRSLIPKFKQYIPDRVIHISPVSLDPFVSSHPWSRALTGKRVLVIHPFAELIQKQYTNREMLFDNKEILPEFELRTIPAVQSLGGENGFFSNWFDALEWMEREMDKAPYDIALIGCGAYGFPLAAYAKKTGHKAIHLGGTLQLLFGIKGKRWESPEYGSKYGIEEGFYAKMMDNPYWVRPEQYITPEGNNVEGGCYW